MRRYVARFLCLAFALSVSVSTTSPISHSACVDEATTSAASLVSYDPDVPDDAGVAESGDVFGSSPISSTDAGSPQCVRQTVNKAYGRLPLSFEANQGQTDARVRFLSRNNGYNLFLTADEAVLSLQRGAAGETNDLATNRLAAQIVSRRLACCE